MKIAVVSDTQGNLPAFSTVLKQINSLDVDIKVHLGNIVGACPYPNECINLAIAEFNYIVRGKTDNALIDIDNAAAFSPIEKEAATWNIINTSNTSKDLVNNLEFAHSKGEFLFVNNSPSHIRRVIHGENDAELSFSKPIMPFEIAFVGGTGVPSIWVKDKSGKIQYLNSTRYNSSANGKATYLLQEGSRYIINVGAVGLPRDNDSRASFVIYDTQTRQLTMYKVPYSIDKTVGKMQQKGFSTKSYMRLLHGN